MDIKITGEYTLQELRGAYRLHMGPSRVIAAISLTALGGYALAALAYNSWRGTTASSLPVGEQMSAFLVLLGIAGLLFALPTLLARAAIRTPSFRGPIQGRATASGLSLFTEVAQATHQWPAFLFYRASADLLLLYRGGATMQVIPRSFCASDDDWQALLKWVADHAKERRSRVNYWGLGAFLALVAFVLVVAVVYNLLAG